MSRQEMMLYRHICCTAHAGMSATYPLDMVRGRLTVQSIQGNHRYRGIMHATSVIIKEASPPSTQTETTLDCM